MSIFGISKGHFQADIKVYPCGPDPDLRNNPAFNGIRWSFVYADDIEKLGIQNAPHSDVWPDFLDQNGMSTAAGIPLIGSYNATMHIVSKDMIGPHFERLRVGTKFFCMEGTHKVAEGRVTRLSTK